VKLQVLPEAPKRGLFDSSHKQLKGFEMTEESVTNSQAEAVQPQAGASQAASNNPQAGTATQPTAAVEHETISLEEAKKLRSEANSLRRRLKEFEDKEEASKEASLSEVQKVQKRLTEAETEAKQAKEALRAARIENAIIAKARDRFIDLDDVVAKLRDSIEVDDNGQPVELEKALDALATAKPHWLKQAPAPEKPKTPAINPTNPGAGGAPAVTDAELRAEIWGTSSRNTIFNPARTEQHGGGVVEVSKRK